MTDLQDQIDAINRGRQAGDGPPVAEAEIEVRFRASTKLFIYGTLRPGASNHHMLDGVGGTWAEATVRGHLSDDGWGASRGYPAITLHREGDRVPGVVLVSARLVSQWTRLDEFEGHEYCRSLTRARLSDGTEDVVNVYALRASRRGLADGAGPVLPEQAE